MGSHIAKLLRCLERLYLPESDVVAAGSPSSAFAVPPVFADSRDCAMLIGMTNPFRNPHAGQPFDGGVDFAVALEDVSVPALLCSLVHMTGDPSWIRSERRPRMAAVSFLQSEMPDDELAGVRAEALAAIETYSEGGCQPRDLPRGILVEMMEFLACNPLSTRMRDLFFFDLQLEGRDTAAITWGHEIEESVKCDSSVVVIGAGMAGIQAGIRLAQAGLPFTIVEKNQGPGGTWWENRYPGARVDVASHQYCYAFEPADHWSEYYCQHPELRAYFTNVLDKHELRPHCRFETEVVGAMWDEGTARWSVRIRTSEGKIEELDARFVISAVGSLNIPNLPEIEGMDRFQGESFHSTRWPEDFDHSGKRFALLGAGASGFQIAPTIADEVECLSIFQRTAQWVMPNSMYHTKVPPGETWAMQHLPFYARWLRFMMTYPGIGSGIESFRIDPTHKDPSNRSVNAANAAGRDYLLAFLHTQLEGRPDLIEKVLPSYPTFGKRVLQDDGSWFQCLRKSNVELVRTGIKRIVPEGIETTDGTTHPVDVICYATGFKHNQFVAFDMIGRGGTSLHAQWGDEPSAYLGITAPKFPNVFFCYGPGTNLAHSAGLFFHSEYQTMHAMQAIHRVLAADARSIEVRQDVHDRYVDRLVQEISALVWAHPTIQHSHYKNPNGRVYTLSPWPIDEYWEMTRELDPKNYLVE
ncbi:MAG TPA: NAD(P)/FAD-dependent oxidoreductase [Myxococcales bacterium]|nr:NAD(P)/FAD-dependent oxidoreductase [Myxococcales bacterium]